MTEGASTLVAALEGWATRSPAAPALLAPGRAACSYLDLRDQTVRVAAQLAAAGVTRSDAVAVVLPNGPEMAAAFLGVGAAAACAPLNPSYTETEVGFYLDDLRARAVIVSADAGPAIAAAEARGLLVVELRPVAGGPAGAFTLDGLPPAEPVAVHAAEPEDVALVLHTSGTTSRPKQVPLSHRNIAASARNVAATLRLGPHDRCLNVMPLFHIHGLIAALSASTYAGASVACTPGFDPDRFFDWIDELEPTWYTAVPTIHQAVLSAARRRGIETKAGAFRLVRSSSAALPPSVMASLEAMFDAPVIEAYGMTEAAHQMASNPLPPAPRKPGSVGLAAGPEIAIADESGRLLAPGETGEIVIRGENITAGYIENPTANAESFFDGWFRTGDEGVLDDDGYLTITGRLKEIINRGGEKIAPREVEERLLTHPAVAQAVVFAAPHPTLGEDVAAAVVLAPGSDATVASLRAHVAAELAPFKVPRQILVRDDLPLGATGKLQRIGMADRLGMADVRPSPAARATLTPLEGAVRGIWQSVLDIDDVGVDDDFFSLGGDSLAALELVAHVLDVLRVEVPVSAVFDDAATVRGMAAMVQRLGLASASTTDVVADERDGTVAFAEERLWFLDALEPESSAYHVPFALRLRGALDVAALEQALAELVRRHERLRTSFVTVDGRPRAVLAPPTAMDIPVTDLRRDPDPDASALDRASAMARQHFDLANGPLVRAALFRTADDVHLLEIVCHHIVTDARSRGIMRDELGVLYSAFAAGQPSPLPEPRLRYADLAAWQRARVVSAAGEADLSYWREVLRDPPPPLELATDHARPAVQPTEGATLRAELDGALRTRLLELAEANRATLFMALLAGFVTLLHRQTGRTDITVGVPVSGRTRVEADQLVGLFVNTVVVRVAIEPDTPFEEVLCRVRDACLGAYDHQAMPFERLVEVLRPDRDTTHTPLVQTFFHLRNQEAARAPFGDLDVEPVEVHAGGAKFELSIDVSDLGDRLSAHVEYPTALFEESTVRRLSERFALLLADAAVRPSTAVADLDAAAADERSLVAEWGQGAARSVPDVSLHELIAARAAEAPDELAVVDGERRLTRHELDLAANRFANHLAALGVAPGTRVAVCLPRSMDAIVAELGVMKAGAAFVPLDPTHPDARLAQILEDTSAAAVVTSTDVALPCSHTTGTVVLVDRDRAVIDACADEPPDVLVGPDDAAWVLFTSGSTGRAKGVVGRHRTEVNRALWRAAAFPPRPGEVHAHRVPPGFVDMVIEVFGALAGGLAIAVIPQDDLLDPWRFTDLLVRHRVTRIIMTPSHLRVLLDAFPDVGTRLPDLWHWNISGEAVSAELARRFFAAAPGRVFLNTYGSTEAPNATFTALTAAPDEREWDVPAGRPLDNVTVKVADAGGRPAPIGVPGEIWTAGDPTALGYLGDDDLTARRFVADPTVPGGRWFRTGDLGTWRPDGALRHLGRIDRQIKVRGMRVELDEIEAQLTEHPAVSEAAVVAVDSSFGARLVGYVRGAPALDVDDVRVFLSRRVPRHAVPADLVVVDDFPRTSTGKLDRLALGSRPTAAQASVDARALDEREQQMAALWADLLERDATSIGVDDDFFDLGGHSLLAIELVVRIEQAFGVHVPLRQLFETPTLGPFVAALGDATVDPAAPATAVCLARGAPDRTPVFFLPGLGSTLLGWRGAAALLDERLPLYGLDLAQVHPSARLLHRVGDFAEAHIELLRATVGDRPVVLCGHSFGGLVAYEMARRLAARGHTVAGLVLVDTAASRKVGRQPLSAELLPGAIAGTLRRRWAAARRSLALRRRNTGVVKTRSSTERWQWTIEAQRAAIAAWTPSPYDGSMTLLAVEGWRLERDDTLGWDPLVGSLEVVPVPGVHEHLLTEEWLPTTTAALGEVLLRLTEAADRPE